MANTVVGFEFGLNVFGSGQLTVPAVTYVSPAKTANHIPRQQL
jgi:hypothetical protein